MGAWWDVDRAIWLVTPEEFAELEDGTVLTCIDGTTATKGVDVMDNDTRGGMMAYGVTGNHPLRVKALEELVTHLEKPKPKPPGRAQRVWDCKVGVLGELELPGGADGPMRHAVEDAFFKVTGRHAHFMFSGWGGKLDEEELAVIDERAGRAGT